MRLAPSSAPHSFSRYGPSPVSHSSSRPASQWTYFGGHRSVRGNRGRPDHHSLGTRWSFRTVCPGCWGYGYPYYGYDPFLDSWWWDSGSYPNEEQVSSPTVAEESENPDEQPSQDQDAYAGPPSDPPAPQDPATVLVFRDGHHQEIQNYAIVGPLLWNFTGSRTEKIPLTSLDIAATKTANEDRGEDYHLPTAPAEGQ